MKDFETFMKTFKEWIYSKALLQVLEAPNKYDMTIEINWFELYSGDVKEKMLKDMPNDIKEKATDEEIEKQLHKVIHKICTSAIAKETEDSSADAIMEWMIIETMKGINIWIQDKEENKECINASTTTAEMIYYPIGDNKVYMDGIRIHFIGRNEE